MALVLTLPTAGQEKGLAQLLSGKTHPLSMKLKDLAAVRQDWGAEA